MNRLTAAAGRTGALCLSLGAIYVVEILRYKDIGDPFTTYLAKAIAIALRCRSLFLENGSPYGPVTVRFWRRDEWKPMMREMLQELRLLLMQSQEAGLGERRYLIQLYGTDAGSIDGALEKVKPWSEQKTSLYKAVESVLLASEPSEEMFESFLKTVECFSRQTKRINIAFTAAVLARLNRELQDTGSLHIESGTSGKPT